VPSKKRNASKPRLTSAFVAIIVFKYLKAAAFILLGVVALKFAQLPAGSEPLRLARLLQVHSERESVRRLADFLAHVTPRQVQAAGLASFFIALFFLAEGTLLAMRVWWATYFTIVLTALALPIEVREIIVHPDRVRAYVLLAVNLAILIYLWTRRNEFRTESKARERPAA